MKHNLPLLLATVFAIARASNQPVYGNQQPPITPAGQQPPYGGNQQPPTPDNQQPPMNENQQPPITPAGQQPAYGNQQPSGVCPPNVQLMNAASGFPQQENTPQVRQLPTQPQVTVQRPVVKVAAPVLIDEQWSHRRWDNSWDDGRWRRPWGWRWGPRWGPRWWH